MAVSEKATTEGDEEGGEDSGDDSGEKAAGEAAAPAAGKAAAVESTPKTVKKYVSVSACNACRQLFCARARRIEAGAFSAKSERIICVQGHKFRGVASALPGFCCAWRSHASWHCEAGLLCESATNRGALNVRARRAAEHGSHAACSCCGCAGKFSIH